MVLIIGGAWQGKLDFAKETYSLAEEDVFTCQGVEIDFSRRCVDRLEEFTLACVQAEKDPVAYFEGREELWRNSILICGDISCGVVPMSAELRLWRNETGRLCQYLAKNAARVSRIFCGLEQRLK
ncbi:MAG: bifunctional adenosylcobinamide kinase/adenosylcobinamide-phosphate guanylyltransferase [Oscillospiraceae bacterium]|nr:bifunctional adenosylcobinamide kinase/adenosylcobinamide-phosphate guanylyltransferase [Oscillospiraceae bacterium]